MYDLLNSSQKKLLRRLATYPAIAFKSVIAFAICLFANIFSQAAIAGIMGVDINGGIALIGLVLAAILFGIFVYTMVYSRTKMTSLAYKDIQMMANEYAHDNPFLKNATPEQLCDFFKVDYNKGRTNLFIIVPLIITVALYGVGLYGAANEKKQAIERIEATYSVIEDTFGDLTVGSKTDPRDDYDYYSYSMTLEKQIGRGVGSVEFSVRKNGKIDYVDYRYSFDDEVTLEENLENAANWFEEIGETTPALKDYYNTPELADFKYRMSNDFKKQVTEKALENSDKYESVNVNSKDGHYSVYEYCSFYTYNHAISMSISAYYHEYL